MTRYTSLINSVCPPPLRKVIARVQSSPLGYRLLKGAFWSLTGAVISRGLMFAATVLVARILGKNVFGELGMIQSTVGMFGVFAGFGLGLTATKHVAEFRDSDPDRAGRIIGLSELVAIVTGGLLALGLFLFAPWLAEHIINAPHLAGVLRIAALILFINALNGAQTGALSGFEAFKTIAHVNVFVGLISFPLLVCGAWFGGLTGAVWALTINLGVNWLLNHLALRKEARRYRVPFTFRNCGRESSVLWTFSLPLALSSSLAGPVLWAANALLVNQPEGYAELGLYTAVYQLFLPASFVTAIAANVYLPILSSSFATDSLERFRVHAKKMLFTNGIGLLLFSLVLLGLSPLLLPIYGGDFRFSFNLTFFVFLSSTLAAFGGYLNSILIAMHMPYYGLIGNAIWAVIYLPLFRFLSRFGAVGMAISLLISLFLSQVFIEYQMAKKIFGVKGSFSKVVFPQILAHIKKYFKKSKLRMSTTTAFFRNINQLNTIYELMPTPKKIFVFGCSNGSEVYTLAMFYNKKNANTTPQIVGFDIDEQCLEKARRGIYSFEELLYANNRPDESTARELLEEYIVLQDDGQYRIVEKVRTQCRFNIGSVLDPNFMGNLDKVDIVFCQNVLIHMTERENSCALELLKSAVRPGGLLVLGGLRLSVKAKIVKRIGLVPVTTNCCEIHEMQKDLRRLWDMSNVFNRPYYAMPPFTLTDDWQYRFSTIFRVEGSKTT